MRRLLLPFILIATLFAVRLSADITLPYTFTAGTTILASEVNANFSALASGAMNKAGDTLTGTLTVATDVTIDGVDLSDFLSPSGYVLANGDGSATTPAFARSTDTNTGLYFPAADQLAAALGGTQRLLLNSSGLTVFGVNIVNSSGKIPALTTTYLASLDASTLTGLAPANFAAGTAAAAITFSNASNSFTGSGAGLTSIPTSALTGTIGNALIVGTYSSAVTIANVSNSFRGSYNSSDNSAGVTQSCNGTAGVIVVKNGIVTSCTS